MSAHKDILQRLGIADINPGAYDGSWIDTSGEEVVSYNPWNGERLAGVRMASAEDYARVSAAAHAAYLKWRELPAPKRGEYVRRMGNAMREHKDDLEHDDMATGVSYRPLSEQPQP